MKETIEKLKKLKQEGKLTVKFIRLGKGGGEFKNCFDKKLIYFGFSSNQFLDKCNRFDPSGIAEELKDKGFKKEKDTFRQFKAFFDEDETLWITTANRKIYYGFTNGDYAFLDDGKTYKNMLDGWICVDIDQKDLNISGINGGITKTLSYQSTICDFKDKYAALLVNRILCEQSLSKVNAEQAFNELIKVVQVLIQQFTDKDFELLIELIISRMGFKRVGVAGKQEEFIDLEIENPLSGEHFVVQDKSSTDQKTLYDYIKKYLDYRTNNTACKMIYAFHTAKGEVSLPKESVIFKDGEEWNAEIIRIITEDVILWDAERISRLAINNGLADWVIKIAPV